jgi:hypothetical protein
MRSRKRTIIHRNPGLILRPATGSRLAENTRNEEFPGQYTASPGETSSSAKQVIVPGELPEFAAGELRHALLPTAR